MKLKNKKFVWIFLLIFLITISIVVVLQVESGAAIAKAKISPWVLNSLNTNNETVVLIKIKDNSINKNKLLTDKIQGKNAKTHSRGQISAKVSLNDLKILEKDSQIESIDVERTFNVMLQNSTQITNASRSWAVQINGLNLTGAGQSICIIDSGVNYTHPDLGGCYGNNNISSGCKVWGGIDWCADNTNCLTYDYDPEDLNGHGTHVSGIAAANGSIKGIAPGSRIIMFKASNASGSFGYYDVIDGIDWCVNNASLFNISVISLSLGSNLYSSYCNADWQEMANSINNAIAKNISVVIASGNDGSSSEISAPACIENVTVVGSTTKGDSISGFSNQWNLPMIFAPGGTSTGTGSCSASSTDPNRICSTSNTGAYISYSGTSMATPQVAGAVAIIREYLSIVGKTKTPDEIENILNSSGKSITGTNFTIINIYNAIHVLDSSGLNVSLDLPLNNTLSLTKDINFSCNASSYTPLTNVSFYLWNSSSLVINQSRNISSTVNSTIFNYTVNSGDYKWNCLFSSNLSSDFASSNFSLTVAKLELNVSLPVNGTWNNGQFNVTLNKQGSCIYSLNRGLNISMNTGDNLSFWASNESLLQNANYNVTYYCNDSIGESNSTFVFFQFDGTAPEINLTGPEEGYAPNGTSNILFQYNVTDNLNMSKCQLVLNNVVVAENASSVINDNYTNNISYTVVPGSYSWQINCTDLAGNIGNSSSRSLTINSVVVEEQHGGGGGGGGGGGAAPVNVIKNLGENEIIAGKVVELNRGDKLAFNVLDNESINHTLSIDSIQNNGANISIYSNPVKLSLVVGQEVKLNLTSKDYYDLYLKLESINANKLNITLKAIYELINPPKTEITDVENENKSFVAEKTGWNENNLNIIELIVYFVFGAIIVTGIVFMALKASHQKYKSRK